MMIFILDQNYASLHYLAKETESIYNVIALKSQISFVQNHEHQYSKSKFEIFNPEHCCRQIFQHGTYSCCCCRLFNG